MKKLIHLSVNDEDLFEEAADLFYRTFPNSKFVQDMYTNQRVFIEGIIVASSGERVVGALRRGFNPEIDAMSIDFLAVDEAHRKKGVGNLLLSEVESLARQRNIKRICLAPRTDPAVVNFYNHRGYYFIPHYKSGWMEKVLG